MERYKRRTSSFDQAVSEMFVLGLSTRRTEEFLKGFFGEGILSPQGVSRVFRKVEEELKSFRERKFSDDYVYLFLDGFGVTIRQAFKRPYTVLSARGGSAFGMICFGGDWGWEKGGDRLQGGKFGEDYLLSEFFTKFV